MKGDAVEIKKGDDVVSTEPARRNRATIEPLVDVFENDNEVLLLADLPGVDPSELKVRVEGQELTLEGTWKATEPGQPTSREFVPVDFRRSFGLSRVVDTEKITADLKSGVLTVHLPRRSVVKPRHIEVQVG